MQSKLDANSFAKKVNQDPIQNAASNQTSSTSASSSNRAGANPSRRAVKKEVTSEDQLVIDAVAN